MNKGVKVIHLLISRLNDNVINSSVAQCPAREFQFLAGDSLAQKQCARQR